MIIQDYLKTHTLEELQTNFGVVCKVASPLVSLNYGATSDLSNPMCQECRSLILEEGTWDVVARAFPKFFNYDEPLALPVREVFNWDNVVCTEKLDGSLILLYYYDSKWRWATRGTVNAEGNVGNECDMVFSELVDVTLRVMDIDFKELTSELNPACTYAFELTTPMNQIVVPYSDYKLTWIGCWDTTNGEEIDIRELPSSRIPKVEVFPFTTLEEIRQACDQLSPDDGEGYVIQDDNFNRLKIKSAQYVRIAHFKTLCNTTRQCLEVLLSGDYDDLYTVLPASNRQRLQQTEVRLFAIAFAAFLTYDKIKDIQDQKDFAKEATKYDYSNWLFQMRQGKTVGNIVKSSKISLLLKLLGEKES